MTFTPAFTRDTLKRLINAIDECSSDHQDMLTYNHCKELLRCYEEIDFKEKLLRDMLEQESQCRDMAKKVLSKYSVDGDSHGVPTIVDVVNLLVTDIERLSKCLREEINKTTLGGLCDCQVIKREE